MFWRRQNVEVEEEAPKSRAFNIIFGCLIGIALIYAAFYLLNWERQLNDLSALAKNAREVSSTKPVLGNEFDDELVVTAGVVTSNDQIGDDQFLKPGNFIVLQRNVEMYSWIENRSSDTFKENDASKAKTTNYTYSTQWDANPVRGFRDPHNHYNPEKSLKDTVKKVKSAKVGVFDFDVQDIELPRLSKIQLDSNNVNLSHGAILANKDYIFIGSGTYSNPQVGDLRISYTSLNSGTELTVFGKLEGNKITPYVDEKGNKLFRVFVGSKEDAIKQMHTEYGEMQWTLTIGGFVLIWIGMFLILRLVVSILAFIAVYKEIGTVKLLFITLLCTIGYVFYNNYKAVKLEDIYWLGGTTFATITILGALLKARREKREMEVAMEE